jgi:putative endonuclease
MNRVSPKSGDHERGKKGEEQAAAALEAAGMEILARNFRSRYGEIDIIAMESQPHSGDKDFLTAAKTVVFTEVKAWSAYGLENLQYSLDIRKQQKIIKTAKYFLSENREYSKMAIRFDVVFVKDNAITHLASAFTERVL